MSYKRPFVGHTAVIIQVIEGELERIDVKSPPSNSDRTQSSLQPQTPNEAKSFNASLSIDSFQRRVVLGEANLLGIGDSSSVGYSRTEATNDWDFSYTLPLWGIPLVSVDSIDGTGQESGLYFSVQYNR